MAGSETCTYACCASHSVLHRAPYTGQLALSRPQHTGQIAREPGPSLSPLGPCLPWPAVACQNHQTQPDRGRLPLAAGDREPDLSGELAGASAIWGRACDGGRSARLQGSDIEGRRHRPDTPCQLGRLGLGWRARDVNSMHSLWAETGPGADEPAGLPWVRSWAYVLGDMARGCCDSGM